MTNITVAQALGIYNKDGKYANFPTGDNLVIYDYRRIFLSKYIIDLFFQNELKYLLLQEIDIEMVNTLRGFISNDMDIIYQGSEKVNTGGNAILFVGKILSSEPIIESWDAGNNLKKKWDAGQKLIGMVAKFVDINNNKINIINVHLDLKDAKFSLLNETIWEKYIEKDMTNIIGGDFNLKNNQMNKFINKYDLLNTTINTTNIDHILIKN
jgi:hypothetical protein